jgi:CheY-like chemotaxis protein
LVTGRKLLLADDSVTIQKVIDLTFSDEGIEVTTVSNGEQAILKLEEMVPDIVLADIFMPGRSGYEVCEHIKRDERFRHIPVMLLVGSFEPFDEAEARRVGADDYLTKPFQSIRQLVSKVTSLLGGGGGEEEAPTRNLDLPKGESERALALDPSSAADIHTADTAPLPQELEGAEPDEAVAHLAGHESLDDELIETHSAEEIEEPRRTAGAVDARPTAPFSESDLKEAGIELPLESSPAPPAEPADETVNNSNLEEMNEEPLSIETQEATTTTSSRYMSNAAAADEALLDLGDIEPPVSTTEADDFILDLQDDEEPRPQMAETMAGPAAFAESAQAVTRGYSSSPAPAAPDFAQGPASTQPSPEPAAAAPQSQHITADTFEASSPFAEEARAEAQAPTAEAPPAVDETFAGAESFAAEAASPAPEALPETRDAYDTRETFERQPTARGFDEQTSLSMQETMLPEEAYFETPQMNAPSAPEARPPAALAETLPSEGQITLEQLSPEAIDAIARRAVELLSTKVVEEVAWEVVPQLAELLIKRKLEEEKSQ